MWWPYTGCWRGAQAISCSRARLGVAGPRRWLSTGCEFGVRAGRVRRHVADMNPKLSVLTAARGGWFTRADAIAAGYSDSELRRRLRAGQWSRLTRDVYVEPAGWPTGESPWERARRLHLLRTRAVVDRMGSAVVVSHQSAVVLHGLPTWGLDLTRIHVSRVRGRQRSDAGVDVHRSRFAPGEITVVDGLPVVTPARAITETACVSSYEVGVVLADAALHQRLVTPESLMTTADRHRYRSGSPAARAAVRFADGLSESVGESRLRVLMANHGLPAPTLQAEIRDPAGRLIGRVDFLLPGNADRRVRRCSEVRRQRRRRTGGEVARGPAACLRLPGGANQLGRPRSAAHHRGQNPDRGRTTRGPHHPSDGREQVIPCSTPPFPVHAPYDFPRDERWPGGRASARPSQLPPTLPQRAGCDCVERPLQEWVEAVTATWTSAGVRRCRRPGR